MISRSAKFKEAPFYITLWTNCHSRQLSFGKIYNLLIIQ